MTSPTIIETPGALDTAVAGFMKAYEMGQHLRQQREELKQHKIEAQSRMDLDAAQRTQLLNGIKQKEEDLDNDTQANNFIQGHLQDMEDPERFGAALSIANPKLLGRILTARQVLLQQQTAAQQLTKDKKQQTALDQAIQNLPPAKQQAARDLVALHGNIPPEVAVALTLGPAAPPTPSFENYTGRINAARGFMEKGMTAGEAYRIVQLNLPSGVDPNYKIPQPTNAVISQSRQKVVMHLPAMEQSNLTLDLLEKDGIRMSIPAQMYREALVRARGGGATAVIAAVGSMGLNLALPDKQRLYVAAQMRGGNAFRYIVSGQQTSDAEFAFILSYYATGVGDDDTTILQKRIFRHSMEQATRAIGDGQLNRVGAVDSMIQLADSQGAGADVMKTLRKMRGYAIIEDQGNTPPVISRDNPTDPNTWDAAAGAVIDSLGVQP